VLKNNRDFFISLKDVSEIIVLGHSYGYVDLPYFKEVKDNIKKSKWKMAYYSQSDWGNCQTAIEICEIPRDQIEMIRIPDLIRK
jgi:hypothetical protein